MKTLRSTVALSKQMPNDILRESTGLQGHLPVRSIDPEPKLCDYYEKTLHSGPELFGGNPGSARTSDLLGTRSNCRECQHSIAEFRTNSVCRCWQGTVGRKAGWGSIENDVLMTNFVITNSLLVVFYMVPEPGIMRTSHFIMRNDIDFQAAFFMHKHGWIYVWLWGPARFIMRTFSDHQLTLVLILMCSCRDWSQWGVPERDIWSLCAMG